MTALRFPNVVLPKAAVIDEAYVLFPVRTAVSPSCASHTPARSGTVRLSQAPGVFLVCRARSRGR